MKSNSKNLLVLSVLSGAAAGIIASFLFLTYRIPSQEELIRDFYAVETATHVSPHHIRKGMLKGDNDFIMVDLRSQEEYEREHVIGAINIPAYKDPDTSAYGDVERIVNSFSELPANKEIIVYCYSTPCMTGRKVGKMLADHDIYVKHLGIGWNEWRYDWTAWNHEHEWEVTNVEDYVISGSEPGKFELKGDIIPEPCGIANEFGC